MDEELGFYIWNDTRGAWLQEDEKSWGAFSTACAFTERQLADDIRERESGDDITYIMHCLH